MICQKPGVAWTDTMDTAISSVKTLLPFPSAVAVRSISLSTRSEHSQPKWHVSISTRAIDPGYASPCGGELVATSRIHCTKRNAIGQAWRSTGAAHYHGIMGQPRNQKTLPKAPCVAPDTSCDTRRVSTSSNNLKLGLLGNTFMPPFEISPLPTYLLSH